MRAALITATLKMSRYSPWVSGVMRRASKATAAVSTPGRNLAALGAQAFRPRL